MNTAARTLNSLPLNWTPGHRALAVRVRDVDEAAATWSQHGGRVLCALEASQFDDAAGLASMATAVLDKVPVISLALGGGEAAQAERVLAASHRLVDARPSAALHLNLPLLAGRLTPTHAWFNVVSEPSADGRRLRWFDLGASEWREASVDEAVDLAATVGACSLKINHAARLSRELWQRVVSRAAEAGIGLEPAGGVDEHVLRVIVTECDGTTVMLLPHAFSVCEVGGRLEQSRVALLLEVLERGQPGANSPD